MIINLLMGDKKAKEDGNRYVLCDAVLLVGRYLDEPKWAVVHDFFEEEKIPFTAVTHSEIPKIDSFDSTQATVVIFEDLIDAPKKIQDLITGYFTHGRLRLLAETRGFRQNGVRETAKTSFAKSSRNAKTAKPIKIAKLP
ncbi:hypothetical protein GLOIN_2v1874888 [Rhizophagus irregularis DAOM 181602=DAOM 197198]|nr:hypothetical protein GLOIN_2v1874888 [Rhizophagus irregularis DAOM 181602=DAOM 197198]